MADDQEKPEQQGARAEITAADPPKETQGATPTVLPPEIADKLPEETRRMLEFGMTQFVGPMPNPLLQHIKPEHISKVLENAEKSDERAKQAHTEALGDKRNQRYVVIGGVALFLMFLGVMYLLVPADRLGLLNEIVKTIVLLFLGGLGGYGLGRASREADD